MRIHPLVHQFVSVFGQASPTPIGYGALDLVVSALLTLKMYPHPVGLGVEYVGSVPSFTHILSTLELRLPSLTLLCQRLLSHTL